MNELATSLKTIINHVQRSWDSELEPGGIRRAFFHSRFANEEFEVTLDRDEHPYCLNSTNRPELMDALGVTLTEGRKQLRLDFDWYSLNRMNLPPQKVILERLLHTWHHDPGSVGVRDHPIRAPGRCQS